MQVYVPYFKTMKNAKCLDSIRRNKQILEIVQIILVNNNIKDIWKVPKYVKNHPNTILWKNKEFYLLRYLDDLLTIYWNDRQKEHACHDFPEILALRLYGIKYQDIRLSIISLIPNHLTKKLCLEHRDKLLSKDYEYYKKHFRGENGKKKKRFQGHMDTERNMV